MVIYRSYAKLKGDKVVELLWDDYDEVMNYYYGLKDYSRCLGVEVWKMRSQPDHVFKDEECLGSWS